MPENPAEERWRTRLIHPRLPWLTRPLRPADLGNELCSMMLTREYMLEDVHYQKVVPNRYVVEVSSENYASNYQPMIGYVIQQWQMKLAECLSTANNRLGQKEYVMTNRVMIEVRPAADLQNHEARILCQVQQEPHPAVVSPANARPRPEPVPPQNDIGSTQGPTQVMLTACLEHFPDAQRWMLNPGMTTLGRLESCTIVLNTPEVLSHRLISGQHAYLKVEVTRVKLFDGSPNGKPSLNGTYVNRKRIFSEGYELKDGDVITLAATDPTNPRPDAPGVVTFRFRSNCNKSG